VLVGRGEEAGRRQRLAHGNKLQVVIHTDAGISIITLHPCLVHILHPTLHIFTSPLPREQEKTDRHAHGPFSSSLTKESHTPFSRSSTPFFPSTSSHLILRKSEKTSLGHHAPSTRLDGQAHLDEEECRHLDPCRRPVTTTEEELCDAFERGFVR
jgi:hypothetical protein